MYKIIIAIQHVSRTKVQQVHTHYSLSKRQTKPNRESSYSFTRSALHIPSYSFTRSTHTTNCPHLTAGLLAETGNTHTHTHTHEIDGVPCTLYLLASPGWQVHIDTGNYTSPLGLTSATLKMSVNTDILLSVPRAP